MASSDNVFFQKLFFCCKMFCCSLQLFTLMTMTHILYCLASSYIFYPQLPVEDDYDLSDVDLDDDIGKEEL